MAPCITRRGAPSRQSRPVPRQACGDESSPCVEQSRFRLLVRVPHDLKHSPTPLLKVARADRRRVRLLWWRRVHAPDPSEPRLFVAQRPTPRSYRPEHRPPAFPLPVSWHAALAPLIQPCPLQTRQTPTFAPGLTPVPAPATLSARHLRMLPPLRRCAPRIHWHCWFIRQRWPAVRQTNHESLITPCGICTRISTLIFPAFSPSVPPPVFYDFLTFFYRTRRAEGLGTPRPSHTRASKSRDRCYMRPGPRAGTITRGCGGDGSRRGRRSVAPEPNVSSF